ncbi:DNA internalization-related competence protein ComEC/Rec2 [Roseateles violae]|uniref:DNA internalization-related competence protein ComEC/Rec2 n=1 Tax=Roseateles violae TaxID=3058042 RepID=A0ABT8DQE5_9BURK|nr:DNA internalization-related competence protein ComEC/Rec2 [Pelomonas sp. PFR6]MDN3920226.1 DNA internalization-related competence protein ComEC/Rec2 [Pelomonas sp. PFR6]
MSSTARALHGALPAMAWLLGLAALQQCARLPQGREFAALLLGLIACLLLARRGRALLWLSIAAALLAFTQGAWRAEQRLARALPEAWEGRDLLLRGRIASLPTAVLGQAGAPGWRFEFELESARAGPSPQDPALALPPRLLLSVYGQPGEAAPALGAGERWQWLARLKRPHGLMNPHGFDYELWLFEQELRATGVVRPPAMRRLEAAPWWSLDAARQRLREALQRRIAEPADAGVLAALSLGDQAAIARADWALFRDTGVAHLLSVSGLHVTMFAWAAQGLVGWLWRRSARGCQVLPAPRVALWAGVLAALAYALFSGWGVPAQRTVWMLASLALLRSLGLRWPWPLCLLLSAVLVTAIDPWAIAQAGFWLSFAAVGLLMASGGRRTGSSLRDVLCEGLRGQWVATLGLAPLSLLFFQQISLLGLLANLLAIPLVSFVITPLALAGALMPLLWDLAELCLRGLMAYLRALAGTGWAVWTLPVAPLWAQAAGLAGGALLVLPLPWRLRLCGLALLLPLLWPAPPRPRVGEFELLAADVGQGTAVLLRTAGHALLYDAGPQYAPGIDAGQRVLLPLLRALGVARLDLLLLSHRDSDHVGGAASLLAGLPAAALLGSLEDGHPLLAGGPPARRCEAGQRWDWDGVRFELLHPLAADYAAGPKSNALSCVLRVVDAAGHAALLTGDIEAAQEQALLRRAAEAGALRSDGLLVPHHGSKTSSSEALLAAVAPRWALAQAGYRNRFGHPALPVLARYQAQGIAVLTSPDCGALRWASGEGQPQCQRQLGARYWHRPGGANAAMSEAGPWPEAGYAAP